MAKIPPSLSTSRIIKQIVYSKSNVFQISLNFTFLTFFEAIDLENYQEAASNWKTKGAFLSQKTFDCFLLPGRSSPILDRYDADERVQRVQTRSGTTWDWGEVPTDPNLIRRSSEGQLDP